MIKEINLKNKFKYPEATTVLDWFSSSFMTNYALSLNLLSL